MDVENDAMGHLVDVLHLITRQIAAESSKRSEVYVSIVRFLYREYVVVKQGVRLARLSGDGLRNLQCAGVDDYYSIGVGAHPEFVAYDAKSVNIGEHTALLEETELACSRVETIESTVLSAYPYISLTVFHDFTHAAAMNGVAHVHSGEEAIEEHNLIR